MLNKTTLRLLAAVIIIAALMITHAAAYFAGGSGCERKHATEQLKVNERLGKADDKIDAQTPFSADKRTAVEWLRQHTRSE